MSKAGQHQRTSVSQSVCLSALTSVNILSSLVYAWITGAFYPTEEHGMLVNHQVVAPGGGTIGGDWIAPLKSVHIDHAGELRLIYWTGNEKLKSTSRQLSVVTNVMATSNRATNRGRLGAVATTVEALNGTLGFVVQGNIHLPQGGQLSLCPCNVVAAKSHGNGNDGDSNCVAGGSSVIVNGTDLTMQLCKAGACIEHVDRALTLSPDNL